MSIQEIQQVELSIEQAKEMIAQADSVERLYKNRDFKKVILEGYFEKEPVRLVKAKANPALATEETQNRIDKEIIGIGILEQYFYKTLTLGNQAKNSLVEYESMLEELRNETE